jgi:CrcB protein
MDPSTLQASLAVAFGGALGSVARYWLGLLVAGGALPWGTIVANVSGSLLIGLVAGGAGEGSRPAALGETARLFLTVGFCGGYTTFSSFSLQTVALVQAGRYGLALGHALLSVLACLAATSAGLVAGAALAR